MTESIKELRKICQPERCWVPAALGSGWPKNYLLRPMSIYLTKLFLKIGISANKASLIRLFVGIIAGIFLIFAEPQWWIIGLLLLFLSILLDHTDGEIARYHKSESLLGEYIDDLVDRFLWPYTLACMSLGISNALNDRTVFVFGLLSILLFFLLYIAVSIPGYPASIEVNSPFLGLLDSSIAGKSKYQSIRSTIIKLGKSLFNKHAFVFPLMAVTIADCFVPHFILGSVTVNFRYLCFAVYTIVLGATVLYMIYRGLHHLKEPKENTTH